MIAFIRGKLSNAQAGAVIVDVGGIGYYVQVPLSLLNSLPGPGEEIGLHTHLVVREDGFNLYGFKDLSQLEFFVKLLNVSGVGPKGALAVLTILSPSELKRAILSEDIALLTRVPGVGKKTAGRIVLELKDKVSGLIIGNEVENAEIDRGNEAVQALEALGYSVIEARRAVKAALETSDGIAQTAELVRKSLQVLVRN